MKKLRIKLSVVSLLLCFSFPSMAANTTWPLEVDFNILCSDNYRYPLNRKFENQMELSRVDQILAQVCVSKGLSIRDYSMQRVGGEETTAHSSSNPSQRGTTSTDDSWPRKYNFAVKCSDNKSFNVMRTFLTAEESTESTAMNKSICVDMGFTFIADSPSLVGDNVPVRANSTANPANSPAVRANSTAVPANSPAVRANSTAVPANSPAVRANSAAVPANSPAVRANSVAVPANSPAAPANSSEFTPSLENNARAEEIARQKAIDDAAANAASTPIVRNENDEGHPPTRDISGITKDNGWPRTYVSEVECKGPWEQYRVTLTFKDAADQATWQDKTNEVCTSRGHERKWSSGTERELTTYYSDRSVGVEATLSLKPPKSDLSYPRTYRVNLKCVIDFSDNNSPAQKYEYIFRQENADHKYRPEFEAFCKTKGLIYRGATFDKIRNQ
jgi:hypothetical protein